MKSRAFTLTWQLLSDQTGEIAERLIADAEKAGLALDDLEPEFGAPEVLIREALESDEETPGN